MSGAARWSGLGAVAPGALAAARLELHDAAQPLAAAAYALLEAPPDHSHSNLLWSDERAGFVGRALPGGARCALDPRTLRTTVLDRDGRARGELDPVGRTLAACFGELAALLRSAGERVPAAGLRAPPYDLPDTPVRRGAPFAPPRAEELAELARWLAAAHATLAAVSARRLGAAEVRGWPHHFDLAALLELGGERTLGVGFSPGDESYAEPYLYVSPWPAPPASALPRLPRGAHWHTEDFTSAVVTGSAVLELASGASRDARVESALDEVVRACRRLLEP